MADMSPEDREKLRRLEEEVDRESAERKKKREEEEAKRALVLAEEKKKAEALPVKKDEPSTQLVTDADAHAFKRGLQKKIAVGAGGVMIAYWLMSNIITIAAIGAVVGGAWYFSGKYLNVSGDENAGKKKKDSEAD